MNNSKYFSDRRADFVEFAGGMLRETLLSESPVERQESHVEQLHHRGAGRGQRERVMREKQTEEAELAGEAQHGETAHTEAQVGAGCGWREIVGGGGGVDSPGLPVPADQDVTSRAEVKEEGSPGQDVEGQVGVEAEAEAAGLL